MLRVPLAKPYLKRTLRVNYGWTQTTPKSGFLDPAWDRSVPIYPGMVMMKTLGDNFTLINATGRPAGLAGLYVGGDGIDEPLDVNINAFAVWVLDRDAEFEVLAPAFDNTLTFSEPGTGVDTYLYASTAGANRGKLVPAGATNASANPVCTLLAVLGPSKLKIGGLPGAARGATG
jgi:hypothetical protein